MRVLVIEDDANSASALQELLSEDGFEVELAESIAQARELLVSGFDIALIDLDLPDGCGDCLIEPLRQQGTRTFLATGMLQRGAGNSSVSPAELAVRYAVDGYVVKPYDYEQLVAILSATQGN